MKKMLVAMPSLYNGGAERSLVNLLNELPEDEYEIDVLLLKRTGMFLQQLPQYINVLQTPENIRKLYSPLKKTGMMFPIVVIGNAISRLCTRNTRECRGFRWKYFYGPMIKPIEKHYDIALAYISGEILYLVDEKISADRKIVWIHNDYRSAQHPRKFDYSHLKNMDAIVSISDACVDIMKEEFPEFKDKIYMLENITSSVVVKERAKEFYPNEYCSGTVNILSIGRLHEQKGFDFAISAARIMKEQGLNFKWFIIGEGELKEKLKRQILEENVQDYVYLLGARENPYPYIQNCDIFVQPSRYEGKSVVLDEAKILAKPIVATAYPTVQDQMENGKEGIVSEMSPKGIADQLLFLANNEKLQENLKEYLKKRDYGNQRELSKYIRLFENEV